MEQLKTKIEKAFWLLLLCSPALDLLNGIWAYLLSGGRGGMLSSLNVVNLPAVSPSLAVRLCFLVLMTAYIFLKKRWRSVLMFCAVGFTWVLTVGYEFLRHVDFSLGEDIQYIVRFCYCLMVLVSYSVMLKEDGRDKDALRTAVDRVLTLSLLVLALGVLIPYLFGMGFYTYADRLGYRGHRGFFYAGNDITAVLMLLLPVVVADWMERREIKSDRYAWLQAFACAGGFTSLLIIGTKTAFLAVAATAGVLGAYAAVMALWKKQWDLLVRCAIVGLLVAAIMVTLSLGTALVQSVKAGLGRLDDPDSEPGGPVYVAPEQSGGVLDNIKDSLNATGDLGKAEGILMALLSGRTAKLDGALKSYIEARPWSLLVGVGRGSQQQLIEMDLLEVFFYYGLLGCVTMLWLYLTQGVLVVLDLFRCFSLRSLAVALALALCVGYLFLAGHTLFSVTAGFYFAFTIVYARLFCSKKGLETTIL